MAFLLPAVSWIIGALVAAGAALFVSEVLRDKTSGKTFSILGESRSGKTSFTHLLARGVVGDAEYRRTISDQIHPGGTVTLANDAKLQYGGLRDLPGEISAWKSWQQRVQHSDHVLYLMRSHLLRSDQEDSRNRVRRDLQQLNEWISDATLPKKPAVTLVFSFRDLDNKASPKDAASYGEDLIGVANLRSTVDQLKLTTRVSYAAGSLQSQETAMALLEEIANCLS